MSDKERTHFLFCSTPRADTLGIRPALLEGKRRCTETSMSHASQTFMLRLPCFRSPTYMPLGTLLPAGKSTLAHNELPRQTFTSYPFPRHVMCRIYQHIVLYILGGPNAAADSSDWTTFIFRDYPHSTKKFPSDVG